MDFKFTSEQELIRDACKTMVERDVDPVLARHDASKPLPKSAMLEIYKALAQMGLMAPRLPVEDGGARRARELPALSSQSVPDGPPRCEQ